MNRRYLFTRNYPNGDRYDGEAVEDNLRDGYGTFNSHDGSSYRGEWARGTMHGRGRQTLPSGETYDGPFVRDHREGKEGECIDPHGGRYVGEWRANRRNGRGTFHGSPSDPLASYVGEFVNDAFEGAGIARWRDGVTYDGEWTGSEPHGVGTIAVAAAEGRTPRSAGHVDAVQGPQDTKERKHRRMLRRGVRSYHGTMCQGFPGGDGECIYDNGDIYRGMMNAEYLRHGRGSLLRADGSVWEGFFEADQPNGAGQLIVSEGGLTIRGSWVNGKVHGEGDYECRDSASALFGLSSFTGMFASGAPHGYGKGNFFSGVRYEGEWVDGRPNGKGNMQFRRKDTPLDGWWDITGAFVNGETSGKGQGTLQREPYEVTTAGMSISLPSIKTLTFMGEWRASLPNGRGVLTFTFRDYTLKYEGIVEDGLPCGQGVGTYTFEGHPQPHKYEGEWLRAVPHGQGIARWENGDIYRGEWYLGEYHGEGTAEDVEGTYTGFWSNGKRHGEGHHKGPWGSYRGGWCAHVYEGRGVLQLATGATYEGDFKGGKYHGSGKACTASGRSYIGSFVTGVCEGVAEVHFPGGQRYNGFVKHWDIVGPGTMHYANGDVYEGSMESGGHRHGVGCFTVSDGTIIRGRWRHNVLHGQALCTLRNGALRLRQYQEGTLQRDEPYDHSVSYWQLQQEREPSLSGSSAPPSPTQERRAALRRLPKVTPEVSPLSLQSSINSEDAHEDGRLVALSDSITGMVQKLREPSLNSVERRASLHRLATAAQQLATLARDLVTM